jgi:tRNA-dihydrouridine synthase C
LFWVGVSQRVAPRHRSGRLKQWLNYLRKVYPEAQQAFDELRLMHDPAQITQWLMVHAAGGMWTPYQVRGDKACTG